MIVTDKDRWEAEAVLNVASQFGFFYAAEEIARIRRNERKAAADKAIRYFALHKDDESCEIERLLINTIMEDI